MVTNFLEQLVAEWLDYNDYFVRRNVKVGKRKKGGYDGELDIVGFHPGKKHLVHYETSMDTDSWTQRKTRFSKKFTAGKEHIPSLFEGLKVPSEIEQVALLVYCPQTGRHELGGGRLIRIREFMADVKDELNKHRHNTAIVPEQFTILRALQFANEFWDECKASHHN